MPSKRATSAYSECNRVEADTYRQSACNLGLVSRAKQTPITNPNSWTVSINESHEIVDFSTHSQTKTQLSRVARISVFSMNIFLVGLKIATIARYPPAHQSSAIIPTLSSADTSTVQDPVVISSPRPMTSLSTCGSQALEKATAE
jgi:hypothetical protein